MMWLLFAFLSALFAGLTAILAKCGIENMDSNVATAIRTIVVLIFSWVLVFVMGVQNGIFHLSGKTLRFLCYPAQQPEHRGSAIFMHFRLEM